jgi:hypothetical protein
VKKIIISISIIFLLSSCRKEQEANLVSISQMTTNYDTLIHRVVKTGDLDAYDELFYGLKDSNEAERTDSVMIYSKIMAEKFNYERAYFDYFYALCEKYDIEVDFDHCSNINLTRMGKLPRKEATDWLKKMVAKKMITEKEFDLIKK